MPLRRRVIAPSKLSASARDDLARRLYAVHERIFTGFGAEEFRAFVIDRRAESTLIQLYETAAGDLLGYCAIHRFRRSAAGRRVIVLRAEAGLLPEYRGRGMTYGFGMIRALIEKLRHPFTPVYYLGNMIHASSFHLFCKYFRRLFPDPSGQTHGDLSEIARELVETFSEPAVTPSDPFVRDSGVSTIESPQEKALNSGRDRADVAFFKARNPGYAQGYGLVLLVPMTFTNLAGAIRIRILERLRILLRRHTPDL